MFLTRYATFLLSANTELDDHVEVLNLVYSMVCVLGVKTAQIWYKHGVKKVCTR